MERREAPEVLHKDTERLLEDNQEQLSLGNNHQIKSDIELSGRELERLEAHLFEPRYSAFVTSIPKLIATALRQELEVLVAETPVPQTPRTPAQQILRIRPVPPPSRTLLPPAPPPSRTSSPATLARSVSLIPKILPASKAEAFSGKRAEVNLR